MRDTHFPDAAHADFWRASPNAQLFLLRGYDEDSIPERLTPGEAIEVTIPIWRVGECLLHILRFAESIGVQDGSVAVQFSWNGLEGRNLVSLYNPVYNFSLSMEGRICRVPEIVTPVRYVALQRLVDALPEEVLVLTRPLYNAFQFYEPTIQLVTNEIARLRSKQ